MCDIVVEKVPLNPYISQSLYLTQKVINNTYPQSYPHSIISSESYPQSYPQSYPHAFDTISEKNQKKLLKCDLHHMFLYNTSLYWA